MAKGKKTGGRDFAPGNSGKPKGAKDKQPRRAKASVVRHLAEYIENHPDELQDAIKRGLESANPTTFLALAADHLDGRPVQKVQLGGEDGGPIKVTFGGRYRPEADA